MAPAGSPRALLPGGGSEEPGTFFRRGLMSAALYQVAAQGSFQRKLGRTCFAEAVAVEMAADLRNRG
jgi:hypothetical protein